MIVRDEAPVIARCLASVLPVLDHWVVVDTGSCDGTQAIVRRCLAGVPGELVERPWVDFGHNRTESVGYASEHADYVLVIDADEVLVIEPGFTTAGLTADAYRVESRYGTQVYARTHLLRGSLPWRYVGAVHEYPHCEQAAGHPPLLGGLSVLVFHDGARARDPLTYRRDALRLEQALLDDPGNPRAVFYLAQSYRDAGDGELALRHYRARSAMGDGWQDEAWYSLYQAALLREAMGHPWGEVLDDYLAAYEFQPGRAEPLYRLGLHYALHGADGTALLYLGTAARIPRPGCDRLFVDADVYDYLVPFEHAAACGRSGRHADAIAGWNRLLRDPLLLAERIEEVIAARRRVLAERGLALAGRGPAWQAGTGTAGPAGGAAVRVRVCIPVQADAGHLDDCLESIGQLDEPPCDVWVIDDGCPDGAVTVDGAMAGQVPVHLVRNAAPAGFGECLDQFVRQRCDPGDVVVPLTTADRFAARDVLRHVRAAFADPDCAVFYGQHRRDDGRLGDAEPAADDAGLAGDGATLCGDSPLIFLARAWCEQAAPPSRQSLLRQAELRGLRFTDAVLTARAEPGPASSAAARRRARPPRRARRACRQLPDGDARPARPGQARHPVPCQAKLSARRAGDRHRRLGAVPACAATARGRGRPWPGPRGACDRARPEPCRATERLARRGVRRRRSASGTTMTVITSTGSPSSSAGCAPRQGRPATSPITCSSSRTTGPWSGSTGRSAASRDATSCCLARS